MSGLIDELVEGHQVLCQLLEAVRQHGIDSEVGLRKLLAAKAVLLEHLRAEDEQLYPALRAAAEHNELLARTLSTFAQNMEQISTEAIGFFEKYSQGGDTLEFARDFGHVMGMLNTRISREENILYPEFAKLRP